MTLIPATKKDATDVTKALQQTMRENIATFAKYEVKSNQLEKAIVTAAKRQHSAGA